MNFSPLERKPNDFQQPITAAQFTAVCQRAFGSDIDLVSGRELPSGMFNTTFLVTLTDRQVILRIGPHKAAELFANEHHLLRREYALQPYLGTLSHLTPRTLFADFSHELIERDYVFQGFLAGELWDGVTEELTDTDNTALWVQLAQLAKQLHQTTGDHLGFPYPETQFTAWGAFIISIIERFQEDLALYEQSAEGVGEFMAVLRHGRAFLDEITTPHLLHGDLWPKNVLIDHTSSPPQIIGLLDAERGLWGDPWAEWIFYYLELPEAFWEVYGQPADDPSSRFRRAAYHGMYSVQLLLEAYRFGFSPEEFRTILRKKTKEMEQIVLEDKGL